MSYPAAPFRHLRRLTDNVGLLERAEGIVPRHEHGYCVDDVARAWSWCAGSRRRLRI